MNLEITGIYASLLSLLMIGLSIRVSLARGKAGISLLDGGNREVAERMRMHGNFIETVPIALILMAIAESQQASFLIVNAIGLSLLAGRLMHPFGISYEKPAAIFRAAGMLATFLSMLISVAFILWKAIT